MANYIHPSVQFTIPNSDYGTLYTHPILTSNWNPDRNFHRIINFEPQPLLPNKVSDPLSLEAFIQWKQKNPRLAVGQDYSSWRLLSADGAQLNAEGRTINALNDLYRTGQVRGSLGFQGQAYFNAGFPSEVYRSQALFDTAGRPVVEGNYHAGSYNQIPKPTTKNIYISATPEFMEGAASGRNPLYTGAIDRGFFKPTGGRELTPDYFKTWGERPLHQGVSFRGGYVAITPTENPRFIDRINPWNRKGLTFIQTDPVPLTTAPEAFRATGPLTPEVLSEHTQVGRGVYIPKFSTGLTPNTLTPVPTALGPFNEKVLYDGTTPFWQRSFGQHLRNAKWNATSLYVQPEVQTAIAGATKAGGVASFMLETPSITAREDRLRRAKYPENYTGPRDASLLETAQMVGKGVVGSVANSFTLGMAGVGSNEGRGGRGPARMEDTGNEITRRTIERANSWVPTIDDDIKEHTK